MISLPPRYSSIIKVLPGGGMSDTILCRDVNLQRDVVVKSLKSGTSPRRLLDELTALSAIRSKYVVQVYDIIADAAGSIVGFVEEYLPGSDLAPCAAGSSSMAALRALYPICSGVAEIHEHGRVHRDLKPENMKFDANGQLKIFDFGLAKLDNTPGTTAFYYSPGYTAPEAFIKNSNGMHTYAPPVDVFAFGCIAVWILNGGVLLPGMDGIPPTIPASGPNWTAMSTPVPPKVAQTLSECLNVHPLQRPKMSAVRDLIGAEILRDRHRLLLTFNDKEYSVDATQRIASLSWQNNTSSISISYDGLAFSISKVSGTVVINNAPARIGQILTGSSVIVLGIDDRPNRMWRTSVTCDVSHPEVIL